MCVHTYIYVHAYIHIFRNRYGAGGCVGGAHAQAPHTLQIRYRIRRIRFSYATAYGAYAFHTLPHTAQVVVSEVHMPSAFVLKKKIAGGRVGGAHAVARADRAAGCQHDCCAREQGAGARGARARLHLRMLVLRRDTRALNFFFFSLFFLFFPLFFLCFRCARSTSAIGSCCSGCRQRRSARAKTRRLLTACRQ